MRGVLTAVVMFFAGGAALGYIESLYPLSRFLSESDVIAEGKIDKVDTKNKTCFVRIARSLKGACRYEVVRMNIGVGQEWHPDVVMKHLVVGAPALVFYTQGRAEIYINRFFCQVFGDATASPEKMWWNFTHVELHCNRTFAGTEEELAKTVEEVLAGKAKPPAPDEKLPAITRDHLGQLPVWGRAAHAATLPPSFKKRSKAVEPAPDAP